MECIIFGQHIPLEVLENILQFSTLTEWIRFALASKATMPAVVTSLGAHELCVLEYSDHFYYPPIEYFQSLEKRAGVQIPFRQLRMDDHLGQSFDEGTHPIFDFVRQHAHTITEINISCDGHGNQVKGEGYFKLLHLFDTSRLRKVLVEFSLEPLMQWLPLIGPQLEELILTESWEYEADLNTQQSLIDHLSTRRLSLLHIPADMIPPNSPRGWAGKISFVEMGKMHSLDLDDTGATTAGIPEDLFCVPWTKLLTPNDGYLLLTEYLEVYEEDAAERTRALLKLTDQLADTVDFRNICKVLQVAFAQTSDILDDKVGQELEDAVYTRLTSKSLSWQNQLVGRIAAAHFLRDPREITSLLGFLKDSGCEHPLEAILAVYSPTFHTHAYEQRPWVLDEVVKQVLDEPAWGYHRFDVMQSIVTWSLGLEPPESICSPQLDAQDIHVLTQGTRRYRSFQWWVFEYDTPVPFLKSAHAAGVKLPTVRGSSVERCLHHITPELAYLIPAVMPNFIVDIGLREFLNLAGRHDGTIFFAVLREFSIAGTPLPATKAQGKLKAVLASEFLYKPNKAIAILFLWDPHEDWNSIDDELTRLVTQYHSSPFHDKDRQAVEILFKEYVNDSVFVDRLIECLMRGAILWNMIFPRLQIKEMTEWQQKFLHTLCSVAWTICAEPGAMKRVSRWRTAPLRTLLSFWRELSMPIEDMLRIVDICDQSISRSDIDAYGAFLEAIFATQDVGGLWTRAPEVFNDYLRWALSNKLESLVKTMQARVPKPRERPDAHQTGLVKCTILDRDIPLEVLENIRQFSTLTEWIRFAVASKEIMPAVVTSLGAAKLCFGQLHDPGVSPTHAYLQYLEQRAGVRITVRELYFELAARKMLEETHPIFNFVRDHARSIASIDIKFGSANAEVERSCEKLLHLFDTSQLRKVSLTSSVELLMRWLPRIGPQLEHLAISSFTDIPEDSRTCQQLIAHLSTRKLSSLRIPSRRLSFNPPRGWADNITIVLTELLSLQIFPAKSHAIFELPSGLFNVPWTKLLNARLEDTFLLVDYLRQKYEAKQFAADRVRAMLNLGRQAIDSSPFHRVAKLLNIAFRDLRDIVDDSTRNELDGAMYNMLISKSLSWQNQLIGRIASLVNSSGIKQLLAFLKNTGCEDPFEAVLAVHQLATASTGQQSWLLNNLVEQLLKDPAWGYHRFDILQAVFSRELQYSFESISYPQLDPQDISVLTNGTRRYRSFYWWRFRDASTMGAFLKSAHAAGVLLPVPRGLELWKFCQRMKDELNWVPLIPTLIPSFNANLNLALFGELATCRRNFFFSLLRVFSTEGTPLSAQIALRRLNWTLAADNIAINENKLVAILFLWDSQEDWDCISEELTQSFKKFHAAPDSSNYADIFSKETVGDSFLIDRLLECLMRGAIPWNMIFRGLKLKEMAKWQQTLLRQLCTTAWTVFSSGPGAMKRVSRWRTAPLRTLLSFCRNTPRPVEEALCIVDISDQSMSRRDISACGEFLEAVFATQDVGGLWTRAPEVFNDYLRWALSNKLESLAIAMFAGVSKLRTQRYSRDEPLRAGDLLRDSYLGLVLSMGRYNTLDAMLSKVTTLVELVIEEADLNMVIDFLPHKSKYPRVAAWLFGLVTTTRALLSFGCGHVSWVLTAFADLVAKLFSNESRPADRLRSWCTLFGAKSLSNSHFAGAIAAGPASPVADPVHVEASRQEIYEWYKTLPPEQAKLILRWGQFLVQSSPVPDEQLLWSLFDLFAALGQWGQMLNLASLIEKAISKPEWKQIPLLLYRTAAMVASYKMGNAAHQARKHALAMQFGPVARFSYLDSEAIWNECTSQAEHSSSAASQSDPTTVPSAEGSQQNKKQKNKQKQNNAALSSSAESPHAATAPLPRRHPEPSSSSSVLVSSAPEPAELTPTPAPAAQSPALRAAVPSSSSSSSSSSSAPSQQVPKSSKYESPAGAVLYLQCSICWDRLPDFALLCGHMFCSNCVEPLTQCATCRKPIELKHRIYFSSADQGE